MKLKELEEWIKNHQYITNEQDWYDGCGNREETRIYEDKEGRFWQVEFMNEHPYRKWHGHGFIKDEYSEPVEVFKTQRTIDCYEPKSSIS